MKRLAIGFLALLFVCSSCNIEETPQPIEKLEDSNWTTENFKYNYTIQFPDSYEGYGMRGWEGNMFDKNRLDDKVSFYYRFGNGFWFSDFGESLDMPIPSEIMTLDRRKHNENEVVLDSKREFVLNGVRVGILYHNTDVNAIGKY